MVWKQAAKGRRGVEMGLQERRGWIRLWWECWWREQLTCGEGVVGGGVGWGTEMKGEGQAWPPVCWLQVCCLMKMGRRREIEGCCL